MEIWRKIILASAGIVGIVGVSFLINKASAMQIPPNHQALANRVKVYYPWKTLKLECVFIGQEADQNAPIYPETAWMCVYEDGINRDVAAVMVIYERSGFYDLSFSRQDDGAGGGGEQLCVDIADDSRSPFLNIFQDPASLSGFRGIVITK